MKKSLACLLPFIILILSACGNKNNETPDVFLTPPAISVEVSRENCPSMEAGVGMWVAWKNVDTVNLSIKIEQMDSNGNVIGTGGSEISPDTVFSMLMSEPGIYHVYCADRAGVYATITVK